MLLNVISNLLFYTIDTGDFQIINILREIYNYIKINDIKDKTYYNSPIDISYYKVKVNRNYKPIVDVENLITKVDLNPLIFKGESRKNRWTGIESITDKSKGSNLFVAYLEEPDSTLPESFTYFYMRSILNTLNVNYALFRNIEYRSKKDELNGEIDICFIFRNRKIT